MNNEFDREFLKAVNFAVTPPVFLMSLMLKHNKTARLRQEAMSAAYYASVKAFTEYRARVIELVAEGDLDESFEPFDMFT